MRGSVSRAVHRSPYPSAAPAIEVPAVQVVEKTAPAVVGEAPKTRIVKMAVKKIAKADGRVSRTKAQADASTKQVSINAAGVEELAAVKGLSKKLAERIVKNRPFTLLDDLSQVKGLRTKLFAKVRSRLKL